MQNTVGRDSLGAISFAQLVGQGMLISLCRLSHVGHDALKLCLSLHARDDDVSLQHHYAIE